MLGAAHIFRTWFSMKFWRSSSTTRLPENPHSQIDQKQEAAFIGPFWKGQFSFTLLVRVGLEWVAIYLLLARFILKLWVKTIAFDIVGKEIDCILYSFFRVECNFFQRCACACTGLLTITYTSLFSVVQHWFFMPLPSQNVLRWSRQLRSSEKPPNCRSMACKCLSFHIVESG